MPLILGTNSIKDTGYNVANSVRLNDGDSPRLRNAFGTPTNRKKYTFSAWMKKGKVGNTSGGTEDTLWGVYTDGSNYSYLRINTGPQFEWKIREGGSTVGKIQTNALISDPSAWLHIVVAYDSTQGTAANRMKMYINGTQVSSLNTATYVNENVETTFNESGQNLDIGSDGNGAGYFDGYMAEVVFIDGQQLAADQFGEFDEDSPTIWKPKDVSGLTFGDNGSYLDFEDSSALGNDVSGNNRDFASTNLAATDQSIDTCTNNYSTINSLDNHFYNATLSEGNLKQTANSGNYSFGTGTFGVSQGKWVVEIKIESGSTVRNVVGITDKVSTGTTNELGSLANGWQYASAGSVYNNGSDIGGSYDSYTTNDIIGIYLDLDNNKLYFSKNGTVQNSGTGISITAPSSTTNGVYFFAFGDYGASDDSVNNVNFGSPAFSISSGNTDGTYGNFEYTTTITGDSASKTFKALNSANLAEYG